MQFNNLPKIGNDWDDILAQEFSCASFLDLWNKVSNAYETGTIYPTRENIFRALQLTPFADVKALILGQDPYHTPGAADGLAFSVPEGVRIPPSLRNIFREIERDLGTPVPPHGCLQHWAKRGILLLNSILTVEESRPRSHEKLGWQEFTNAILTKLNDRAAPVTFMLWGNTAQKARTFLTAPQHTVLLAAHPSPLARGKFAGCGHFSWVRGLV
jgi:uracil-DNA glycosylase